MRKGRQAEAIDWTIIKLVLFSALSSIVIAGYVLIMSRLTSHRSAPDLIGQSALYTARQLAQLYVERPAFGRIGICDLTGDQLEGRLIMPAERARIVGINTMRSILERDQEIAEQLKNRTMLKLVFDDVSESYRIEEELSAKLRSAVDPDFVEEEKQAGDSQDTEENAGTRAAGDRLNANRTYRVVYRMLAADNSSPDHALARVSIMLGRLGPEGNQAWPEGKPRLVDAQLFRSCERSRAPYAVLVEATYHLKPNAPKHLERTITKRACAVMASSYVDPEPSAFVFNFPDGLPEIFSTAREIFSYDRWTENGDWQQAASNEVPGKGSLAPPLQPVLPGMTPGQALSVALYHWLRHLGPNVDSKKLTRMLGQKFHGSITAPPSSQPAQSDHGHLPEDTLNSCLVIDTGAREYSIMNQTGPGGAGQVALSRLFDIYSPLSGGVSSSPLPSSAIPLFVDEQGKVNLPGRNGFDEQLIDSYLDDLYNTNLAAIESLSVAKMALARADMALIQINQKIFVEGQELNSLKNRLLREGAEKGKPANSSAQDRDKRRTSQAISISTDGATATERTAGQRAARESENREEEENKQALLAREKVGSLTETLSRDMAARTRLEKARMLSQVTSANAMRVGQQTFELCSHALKLCKEGIVKTDATSTDKSDTDETPLAQSSRAYIIGRKFIFAPVPKPVDESAFFSDQTETDAGEPKEHPLRSVWFTNGMTVVDNVSALPIKMQMSTLVDGTPLSTFIDRPAARQRCEQSVVVLTSARLLADGPPVPPVPIQLKFSPFGGIRIPNSQLFYYCQNALRTGTEPQVSWSAAIRDLVAVKTSDQAGNLVGEPIAAATEEWYSPSIKERAPALACEFQLRTPLPVLKHHPASNYLTNPANSTQVPEVPPVPPDML